MIVTAANILNINIPSSAKPHMFGVDKQTKIITYICACIRYKTSKRTIGQERLINIK
jgi:hypothetical protein